LGYHEQGPQDFLRFAGVHAPQELEYEEGKIYFHKGHLLHQLLPAKEKGSSYRMTLQGHGIFTDQGILAYF
jgi:hypothetical protein